MRSLEQLIETVKGQTILETSKLVLEVSQISDSQITNWKNQKANWDVEPTGTSKKGLFMC